MATQADVKTEDERLVSEFSAALADAYDDDLEWETIVYAALDRCRLILIEKIG